MEALAAVALAGNIIQFVDVANCLCKDLHSLYKGGHAKDIGEIKAAAQAIARFSRKLDSDAITPNPPTDADAQLKSLADQCTKLADEIVQDIDGLCSPGDGRIKRVANAAKYVVRSKSAKNEFNQKIIRLEAFKKSLESETMTSIKIAQRLDAAVMSALRKENEETGARIQDQLVSLETGLTFATDTIISSMARITQDQIRAVEDAMTTALTQRKIYRQMFTVLRSLRIEIPGMMDRKEHIPEAHLETLSWVFKKQLQFTRWLEAGNNIFWISGVPGSGRSTLMKFLMDESRSSTRKYLETWAGASRLVIASFYFWANGTPDQRSMNGLLCALLFQIFHQCPELIGAALPTHIMLEMNQAQHVNIAPYRWTRSELWATLKNLFNACPNTRFCLFVDGLDEYDDASQFSMTHQGDYAKGDSISKSSFDIKDTIQRISRHANVKLCVSSRPWHVFEAGFGRSADSRLDVEKFNEEDIRKYVRDNLLNGGLESLNVVVAKDMADEVVRKSQGVFLWVALVVKSLIRGFTNGDNVKELQKRVEELPKDLDDYFQRMLDLVEERYQRDAVQIIQIALFATENNLDGFPLLLYSFVGNQEQDFGLSETLPKATVSEDSETYELALGRFRTRCPDILRAEKDPEAAQNLYSGGTTVRFVHRTAVDYLKSEKAQSTMAGRGHGMLKPKTYVVNALLKVLQVDPGMVDDPIRRSQWVRWILAHGDLKRDLQSRLLRGYCQALSKHYPGESVSNFYAGPLMKDMTFAEIRYYIHQDARSLWYAEEVLVSGSFLPHQILLTEMVTCSVLARMGHMRTPEVGTWSWVLERGALANAKRIWQMSPEEAASAGRHDDPVRKDSAWLHWLEVLWSVANATPKKMLSQRFTPVTRLFLNHDAHPFVQRHEDDDDVWVEAVDADKHKSSERDHLAEILTKALDKSDAEPLLELLEQKRTEYRARDASKNGSQEVQSSEEAKSQSEVEAPPAGQRGSLWNPLRWLS